MAQKVFIKYRETGDLKNAYSVTLASEDGAFGIKVTTTGEVIFPSGTSVSNPSVGVYEKSFDPSLNTVYTVSWKIVGSAGAEARFVVQQIGPFEDDDGVSAVVKKVRGPFIQGTTGSILITIIDEMGSPIDADLITYSIVDSDSEEVVSGVPLKVKTGCYVFDWEIDEDQDVGRYTVTWSYAVRGVSHIEITDIVVSDVGDDDGSFHYSGIILLFRESLELMLDCAQNVPIYFEQAQPTRDRKTYRFTKQMWNPTTGTHIYRNKEMVNAGFDIDYLKGLVTFTNPLTEFDSVYADYNFRWFSDEQLDRYLSNGLHAVNIFPPETNHTLADVPQKFIPIILYGAAKDALRSMMLWLQYPEPAELFGGPERASQVFGNLETLKKNYHEDWLKLLEQKKLGRYPRGRNIVVPEYTLPGGRSRWFRFLFGTGSAS